MPSKQRIRLPYTEECICQKKLNRRSAYTKIAADTKQATPVETRPKELKLQQNNSVGKSPVETIKPHYSCASLQQTPLAIGEPPPINVEANTYTAVNTPPSSSAKGKLDLEPFCVFEKGSTSTASGDQQNVTPKIVSNKEEKNYQMKLRRRDTYMKITAERKQAMILQRRTKELELQKNKSVTGCPGEKIKSPRNPTSLKQVALTIREPPFGNVQDSMYCEINTLSSSSAKGKQVLQPFPMFESGSTSNTYKRQQNVTPEIPAKKDKG
ncbi:hypothetical protein P3S67_022910 [Capsicum chacoense]